jgi:hypothetical protein
VRKIAAEHDLMRRTDARPINAEAVNIHLNPTIQNRIISIFKKNIKLASL